MGILSNIFGKIFPGMHKQAAPAPGTSAQYAPQATPQAAPQAAPAPQASQGGTVQQPAQPAQQMQEVDVEALLNGMAAKRSEQLNWRTSIVDLMKLLDIDSSLQARKELAQELHYTGDTSDSASMNIWLHRQVMNKLAANGGKVPADLRD
jgi:3-oxoacyl-ACP reductase-like protein